MRTLIVKLGALGDVVRTTPLLRVLPGEVVWVTRRESLALLPVGKGRPAAAYAFDALPAGFAGTRFDLVVSLDDEAPAARIASSVKATTLVGAYLDQQGEVAYTDSAAAWFDMGLSSRFGKARADELKKANTRTYQEILFEMVGRRFAGEEYLVKGVDSAAEPAQRIGAALVVGLETRADARWPSKRWDKFDALSQELAGQGFEVRVFQQRPSLEQYRDDIRCCDIVVTGDTLAMHLAMALRIPAAAIFTCTSPQEIYGYGRLTKIVSPRWEEAFYRSDYVAAAVQAVTLEQVRDAVARLAQEKK